MKQEKLYLFKAGETSYTEVKLLSTTPDGVLQASVKPHKTIQDKEDYYSYDGRSYTTQIDNDIITFTKGDSIVAFDSVDFIESNIYNNSTNNNEYKGVLPLGSYAFPGIYIQSIVCLPDGYYKHGSITIEVIKGRITKVVRNDIPIEVLLHDIYNAIRKTPTLDISILEKLRLLGDRNNRT